MTSSQVLELDLSEVQFEEVSDEKASIIQGGGTDEDNENEALDPQALIPDAFQAFETFFAGLLDVESLEDFSALQEELLEDLQNAVI